MPNILIRDVSQRAIERIDAEAADLGLSRNEYLRRRLDDAPVATAPARVTAEDWRRSADVFADLDDPEVMDRAWR